MKIKQRPYLDSARETAIEADNMITQIRRLKKRLKKDADDIHNPPIVSKLYEFMSYNLQNIISLLNYITKVLTGQAQFTF